MRKFEALIILENVLILKVEVYLGEATAIHIVYVIESALYGVLFTSCLCQKPERARYDQILVPATRFC